MLMCDFEIDLGTLARHPLADELIPIHDSVLRDFEGYAIKSGSRIMITPQGRPLTRIIAQRYDGFSSIGAQYSQAS